MSEFAALEEGQPSSGSRLLLKSQLLQFWPPLPVVEVADGLDSQATDPVKRAQIGNRLVAHRIFKQEPEHRQINDALSLKAQTLLESDDNFVHTINSLPDASIWAGFFAAQSPQGVGEIGWQSPPVYHAAAFNSLVT